MRYAQLHLGERSRPEPHKARWLNEAIQTTNTIGTTTLEVQQLLVYLIRERQVQHVLEVGCFLGATTELMLGAVVAVPPKAWTSHVRLVALDGFLWQLWMNYYSYSRAPGRDFRALFSPVVSSHDNAFIRQIPHDVSTWNRSSLAHPFGASYDLVFLDLTRDQHELERLWQLLQPALSQGESVIVVNGYGSPGVCQFLMGHFGELMPLEKPDGQAKAFLWKPGWQQDGRKEAHGKLRFLDPPGNWPHHKGWAASIRQLWEELHSAKAPTAFVPAVEQFFSEEGKMPDGPWIGVMHQALERVGWVPDLKRIFQDEAFLRDLERCEGLITLTEFSAGIMRGLLTTTVPTVPVLSMKYPVTYTDTPCSNSGPLPKTLLMVGEYMRNFSEFISLRLPENWSKLWIGGCLAEVGRWNP